MKASLDLYVICIVISFFCCEHPVKKTQKDDHSDHEPVRGVWLTNVASDAMISYDSLKAAVEICHKTGINTIYTVVWNGGYTLYPSRVMDSLFGIPIDPCFRGRDPLREVLLLAQKYDIEVHAWFEFGFASSHKQPDGGHILRMFPGWKALNNQGELVSKNDFQWMNAFHPEVQDFLTALILEVAVEYPVVGIQGDDRLPALPSSAGYDAYTLAKYKTEHQGAEPPSNSKDRRWVQWRCDELTAYLEELHDTLAKVRPNLSLSSAPSVYPFSKEEYLQDWPRWLEKNLVDAILPQVYRYDYRSYTSTLDENLALIPERYNSYFFPGLLAQVGDYKIRRNLLDSMVAYNRSKGIKGESYFYFEYFKN